MKLEEVFKALSDKKRRDILELLKKDSMNAGEISSHFNMSSATISYHLSILKKADLIKEKKYKNFIFYELNASVFEELILIFMSFKEQVWIDKKERNYILYYL